MRISRRWKIAVILVLLFQQLKLHATDRYLRRRKAIMLLYTRLKRLAKSAILISRYRHIARARARSDTHTDATHVLMMAGGAYKMPVDSSFKVAIEARNYCHEILSRRYWHLSI